MTSFENFGKEQQMEPEISARILTRSEMTELIYQGESLPQDRRFVHQEQEDDRFKYFNLDDLFVDDRFAGERYFPVVEVDGKVVGVAQLQKPRNEQKLWIKYVSVDPDYRGQGHAGRLTEQIFAFAKEKGLPVETSAYSEEGEKWLKGKGLFQRCAEKYGVDFVDTDRKI